MNHSCFLFVIFDERVLINYDIGLFYLHHVMYSLGYFWSYHDRDKLGPIKLTVLRITKCKFVRKIEIKTNIATSLYIEYFFEWRLLFVVV